MTTQTGFPVGLSPSEPNMKTVSASNLPLMVVVTDADADLGKENLESMPQTKSQSNSHQSLYFRLTKNFVRSNEKRDDVPTSDGITPWESPDRMTTKEDGVKGEAHHSQWRKICKCFHGLKMRKSKKCAEEKTGGEMATLSPLPFSPSRLSPDLRSRLSISPARSEQDFYLCDMASVSEILSTSDVKRIGKDFPPSAVGCPCILTFSTTEDGFSLHSMYRKLSQIDSPVIIVIRDTLGRTFGALLSNTLKVSEHFYGSCDSFLFRCGPPVEIFHWQEGENRYFIHSEDTFLRIGAGNGKCGLWLDDNLFHGRTEECLTFRSPPLVDDQDFEVKTVECWTFGQI